MTGSKYPSRLRWISAGYVLIAVVLSNAYKSNNINNLISGRALLPYQQFHELVSDNFRIYTRSVRHYVEEPPGDWYLQDTNESLIFKILPHAIHEFNRKLLGVLSEVGALASKQMVGTMDNSSRLEKLREIEKHSSLHQSLPMIMKDSYLRGDDLYH